MKRFIVLLVLLAGGLAAAALTIPTNAATVNGSAISQNLLNADITAIANSRDYQCYLNAQAYVESQGQQLLAPVDGVGQTPGSGMHPTATTAFVAPYVDTEISHVMVANLAAQRGLQPTAKEVDAARSELSTQITQTMSEVSQVPNDSVTCASGPHPDRPGGPGHHAGVVRDTDGHLRRHRRTPGGPLVGGRHHGRLDEATSTPTGPSSTPRVSPWPSTRPRLTPPVR